MQNHNRIKNWIALHHALKIAENDSVKMDVLSGLYLYYAENNRDSAMFFTDLGLAISKKLKQPLWTAIILLNKSYLLQRQGNLSMSFKLINESMTIAKDEKSEKNVYVSERLKAGWDLSTVLHHQANGPRNRIRVEFEL